MVSRLVTLGLLLAWTPLALAQHKKIEDLTPPQLDKLYYFSQEKVAENVKEGDVAVLALKKLEVRADFGYTDNTGSRGGPGAETSGLWR